MVYNKLYSEFVDLFPQDMEWFKTECEEKSADEDDGMHVLFGMVVVPFILEVAIHSPEKLKLAFGFIEKMETSEDSSIAEVAEFSILENLIGVNDEILLQCFACMGDETKKAYSDIKKWYKN